ncbi:MAG TPA: ribosomal protein S18-alanine N-acetyltransferase [Aeromicrobium sp.]|nr:ribosomal protein S18-alanine N-acetyltransferase [Aeromicrobium sp.]
MIRHGDAADVEAIAELEHEVFGADAWNANQVAADMEPPLRHVVVAETDGVLVGYAAIAIAGDVADLLRIAVRVASRRMGVASDLLGHVERLAGQAGADRMMLEVAASNEGAQGFYRSRGYGEIARRRGYYAGGGDALVLGRALG